jgi:magnesium chelatase family protein
MNPCPCGNLLAKSRECRCSDIEIQRYKNRLSDPFLDRIDLYVVMNEVTKDDKSDIDSLSLQQKVNQAFIKQKLRGQKELNGKLSDEDIKKYCILEKDVQDILDTAITNFALSFRAINKILKVARTIADIEGYNTIEKVHLLESLSYRKR